MDRYRTFRWIEIYNYIINFNIHGVKDGILKLINKEKTSIKLKKFGAEDLLKNEEENEESIIENKCELYSKMVTYGFLTYYEGEISIPNNELLEKIYKNLKWKKKKKDKKI